MKLLSFSLFKDCSDAEFGFYIRGLYWNARIAKLLLPDFIFTIEISRDVLTPGLREYLSELHNHFDVYWEINEPAPRCESMLWRLKRLWDGSVDAVICRDADSIITQNDANFVNEWLSKHYLCSSINNNKAHHGIMGGLCGFKKGAFPDKSFMKFIKGFDLRKHGSDQHLINKKYTGVVLNYDGKNDTTSKYWESNLIPAFMGSAGINEMEALRFFKRHDPVQYDEFEKQFPKIFYWHL